MAQDAFVSRCGFDGVCCMLKPRTVFQSAGSSEPQCMYRVHFGEQSSPCLPKEHSGATLRSSPPPPPQTLQGAILQHLNGTTSRQLSGLLVEGHSLSRSVH